MALKRKHSSAVLEEERFYKRQLRSGREVQTSPQRTIITKQVATKSSKRPKATPNKRGESSKALDLVLVRIAGNEAPRKKTIPFRRPHKPNSVQNTILCEQASLSPSPSMCMAGNSMDETPPVFMQPTSPLSSDRLTKSSSIMPESRLNLYKRRILKNLHSPDSPSSLNQSSVNDMASKQLSDLINGTVTRAEGNSCLLLGPRGSGKSRMVECCLNHLSVKPIVLRLCGWIQTTDRHALREIGLQLLQQTGASILANSEPSASNLIFAGNEETNPFLDRSVGVSTPTLPPTSHLHALIPVLLTLNRPIIVILDAFDLFALHPRQSLLYCLFDAVQNCRASSDNQGIAVIGITSRVDTIQLLEKRVKSRFSGRTIRTAPSCDLQQCLALVRAFLQPSIPIDDQTHIDEWNRVWASSVEDFLEDKNTLNIIQETFSITRDMKVLVRIMTGCVLQLKSASPYLSSAMLSASAESQRSRPSNLHLNRLSYPSMCLLIASVHINTSGQPHFNFEMLFDIFRDQVRASSSAPVQVNGGSIGMVRCTREVLMTAFQDLTTAKIFISVMAPSNTAKEFTKHRCSVEREVIKKVIEKSAQTNLKKWLNRAP